MVTIFTSDYRMQKQKNSRTHNAEKLLQITELHNEKIKAETENKKLQNAKIEFKNSMQIK